MDDRCLTPEEIAEIAAAPADDPRRSHLDVCPRCRALDVSREAFLEPPDLPPGADPDDAARRLAAALEAEIGSAPDAGVVRPAPSFWSPWRVRAVAALAAVLLVAVGLTFAPRPGDDGARDRVLRGGDDAAAPFACSLAESPTGGRRLSWSAVDGADSYRIVVYGGDLAELVVHDAGDALEYELETPSAAAFCRVFALEDGEEIARSVPAYLDVP